jgi:hypothetical protein
MSGKKLGLEGKYKNFYKSIGTLPAASGNKNTLSINPMQDDFNKSMGMGTTGAFLTRRAILGAGSKNASSLLEKAGKSSVKETFKKANIMGATGYAGYEIGKNDGLNKLAKTTKEFIEKSKTMGKKYGGKVMKKMLIGGQAKIDANKDGKITGEDFKMLQAKKKGMKVKKANLGLLMANKKIAGAGLLGLGMLAKKKGMFSKGGESKIKKVMGEYKKGELNIGKSKKKVKNRKQAIAIALSEARKKQKSGKRKA